MEVAFLELQRRLQWHNPLGLAMPEPEFAEEAKGLPKAWVSFLGATLDGGPTRTGRKGESPGRKRISQNLCLLLPQYVSLLLVLLWFGSLSGCGLLSVVGLLQLAAVYVPLDVAPQVEPRLRLLVLIFCNLLLWILFFREAIFLTHFFIKVLGVSLVVLHAYVVKPLEP